MIRHPLISQREESLVEWFCALYAQRTPAKSVLDADPHYRVTWTEIHQKMRECGYTGDVVALRYEWDAIYKKRHLHRHCNRLLREAGERQMK